MKHLRVGTDCSGIEAPIQALQQLKIPFIHEWSCEKDKYAIESIKANYNCNRLYTDITTRNHSELPDIDLYVCGFPCQAFSTSGRKLGMKDPRGNIMFECIKVIQEKNPKYFILENVRIFKTFDKGTPFNILINALDSIGVYHIYNDIYNTRDYGIPQNRQRLYILGIRKDIQKSEYTKPKCLPMRHMDDFMEEKIVYKRSGVCASLAKNLNKIKESDTESYIVNTFNFFSLMKYVSPTLNTHCGSYYTTKYNRYLSARECLNLQGFSKDFKQVTSKTQMCKQAGNTMSVNVLKEIMKQMLECSI
jgi:DNA (cytosine-5)-methyltransferase 1